MNWYAIVGRVMPEMPKNEIDRNEKDPTNDPNNQLKERDQKQLEKIRTTNQTII